MFLVCTEAQVHACSIWVAMTAGLLDVMWVDT